MKLSVFVLNYFSICVEAVINLLLYNLYDSTFKDIYREKAPSNQISTLSKSMNMDIWVVSKSKQLSIRASETEIKCSKKQVSYWQISVLCDRSIMYSPFYLFVLTLASDMVVLYGTVAFSIFVLSTKKLYSSFLKKAFVLQKICFKVKVLKTFKMFTDCHIKTCRSLSNGSLF